MFIYNEVCTFLVPDKTEKEGNLLTECLLQIIFLFVRAKGLEPPRLSALDPKSSAATNYATPALRLGLQRYALFLQIQIFQIFFLKNFYSLYKIMLAQLSISLVAPILNPFFTAHSSSTGMSSV